MEPGKEVMENSLWRGGGIGIDGSYRKGGKEKCSITKTKMLLISSIYRKMANNKNKMADNKNILN